MITDEEIEEYLGSPDCLRSESPLTIWNTRQILLLKRSLELLATDSLQTEVLSEVGKGIMRIICKESRPVAEKHVRIMESFADSVTDGKYVFDFHHTPKRKIYRVIAQLLPYMDNQERLYSYICEHSNLDIQPASLKNAVYYWLKKKVQK
jgi:hypothetical protein